MSRGELRGLEHPPRSEAQPPEISYFLACNYSCNNWRAGASKSQSLQRQKFFYIIYIYIFVVDLPSAHERPYIPTAHMSSSPVVLLCAFKNGNLQDPRTARSGLARRRKQYRQRYAAETADAREARLERQRAGKCSA